MKGCIGLIMLICSSCSLLPGKEEAILHRCRKVSEKINLIKEDEITSFNNLMLQILQANEKEERILTYLKKSMIEVDTIDFRTNETESRRFLDVFYSELKLDNLSNLMYRQEDSIYYSLWKNYLKIEMLYYFASHNIYPSMGYINNTSVVLPESNVVEQGKAYKVKFFLGGCYANTRFIGEEIYNRTGRSVYSEVEFLPNQSNRYGMWRAALFDGLDTLRITIPYEIID